MIPYRVSPEAKADLDGIEEYIARDSVDAAERWIAKLLEEFRTLAANPALGHTRRDLTSLPVLFWPVHSYVIVYRVAAAEVEILAVSQGSRDFPRLLGQRAL